MNARDTLNANAKEQQKADNNVQQRTSPPRNLFVDLRGINKSDDGLVATVIDAAKPDSEEFQIAFNGVAEKYLQRIEDGILSKKHEGEYFRKPFDPESHNNTFLMKNITLGKDGFQASFLEPVSESASLAISDVSIQLNSNRKQVTATVYATSNAELIEGDSAEFLSKLKSVMDVSEDKQKNVRAGALIRFVPNDKTQDVAAFTMKHNYQKKMDINDEGVQEVVHLPSREFDEYIESINERRNDKNPQIAAHASAQFSNLATFVEWADNPSVEGYIEIIPTFDYRVGSHIKNRLFEQVAQQVDSEVSAEVRNTLSGQGKVLNNQYNIYKDVTNESAQRARQSVAVKTLLVIDEIPNKDIAYISGISPSQSFTYGQLPHQISTEKTNHFSRIPVSNRNRFDAKFLETGKPACERHKMAIDKRNGVDIKDAVQPEISANQNSEVNTKAAKPETAKPKAAEPKAAEPKAAEPKAAEPKAAEPKAAEPEIVNPEAELDVDDGLSFDNFDDDIDALMDSIGDDLFGESEDDEMFDTPKLGM